MRKEMSSLSELRCWKIVLRPIKKLVLHTKFVLCRKREAEGRVSKHKARLVIFVNEEDDCQDDSFLRMADFTALRSLICIFIQKGWKRRHLDFASAFSPGKVIRKIYAELPACLFSKHDRDHRGSKLKRSLYGINDAAPVWHDLLVFRFTDLAFRELESALFIIKRHSLIVIMCIDDLIVFGQTDSETNELAISISKNLKIRYPGVPARFLGIPFS